MKKQLRHLLFALAVQNVAGSIDAVLEPQLPTRGTVLAGSQELFGQFKSLLLTLGAKSPDLRDEFAALYGQFGRSLLPWVKPVQRAKFLTKITNEALAQRVQDFDMQLRKIQKRRLALTGGGALATAAALMAIVAGVKYARRGKPSDGVIPPPTIPRPATPADLAGRPSPFLDSPVLREARSPELKAMTDVPPTQVQAPTPVRAVSTPVQNTIGGDDFVTIDLDAIAAGTSDDGVTGRGTGLPLSRSASSLGAEAMAEPADFSAGGFNSAFGVAGVRRRAGDRGVVTPVPMRSLDDDDNNNGKSKDDSSPQQKHATQEGPFWGAGMRAAWEGLTDLFSPTAHNADSEGGSPGSSLGMAGVDFFGDSVLIGEVDDTRTTPDASNEHTPGGIRNPLAPSSVHNRQGHGQSATKKIVRRPIS